MKMTNCECTMLYVLCTLYYVHCTILHTIITFFNGASRFFDARGTFARDEGLRAATFLTLKSYALFVIKALVVLCFDAGFIIFSAMFTINNRT